MPENQVNEDKKSIYIIVDGNITSAICAFCNKYIDHNICTCSGMPSISCDNCNSHVFIEATTELILCIKKIITKTTVTKIYNTYANTLKVEFKEVNDYCEENEIEHKFSGDEKFYKFPLVKVKDSKILDEDSDRPTHTIIELFDQDRIQSEELNDYYNIVNIELVEGKIMYCLLSNNEIIEVGYH